MPESGWNTLMAMVLAIGMFSSMRVVNQYQRLVVLRFGRYIGTRAPGLTWLTPIVDIGISVSPRRGPPPARVAILLSKSTRQRSMVSGWTAVHGKSCA